MVRRKYQAIHPDIYKDKTLYKQMTEFSLEGKEPTKVNFIDDSETEHILNSLGYRSSEFTSGTKILAAGCSNTVGLGVDQDKIWSSVLSDLTGMSCANLGIVGGSFGSIAETVMAHIRAYGAPEVVCVFLPGLYRIQLPINEEVNTYLINKQEKDFYIKNVNLAFFKEGTKYEKAYPDYSLKPYNVNDVISLEIGVYYSMMSLNFLVDYCRAAGIKLIMSSWEPGTTEFLLEKKEDKSSKLDLSNFYPLDMYEVFFNNPETIKCHTEIDSDVRGRGRDTSGHMGEHQHRHVAELFASKIN